MAKEDDVLRRIEKLTARYRVTDGRHFRLEDVDPRDTAGLGSDQKSMAREILERGIQRLSKAQDRLYAQGRRSLLLIFQAMDAAGKDATIKHVMSGINPQGCQVSSFKQPSTEELDHDYLWRCAKALPERGRIGIFNRSYYEEVIVVRVHKEILQAQKLPADRIHKGIFKERLRDIAWFERYLARNGTTVLKFFLHISRGEQKRRFLARLDRPEKNWKFSAADIKARASWDDYMDAYERAIRATATEDSPWMVVPADNKWFTQLVVAATVLDKMESMKLKYPQMDGTKLAELAAARRSLQKAR